MNCAACQDRLPEFASDALASAEAQEVRQHLRNCRTCQRELDVLRDSIAALALTLPGVAPPPRVKQDLLARIRDRAEATGEESAEHRPVAAARTARSSVWRTALPYVAVSLCAMAAGAIAVRVFDDRIARQEQLVQQFYDRMEASRRAFPSSRIQFASHGEAANSRETAFYLVMDPQSREVHFHAVHLEPAASGNHLELWLATPTGRFLPLGPITPNADGSCAAVYPLPDGEVEAARAIVTEETTTADAPQGRERVSAEFEGAVGR